MIPHAQFYCLLIFNVFKFEINLLEGILARGQLYSRIANDVRGNSGGTFGTVLWEVTLCGTNNDYRPGTFFCD